jgi:hypothetical protein
LDVTGPAGRRGHEINRRPVESTWTLTFEDIGSMIQQAYLRNAELDFGF